MLSSSLTWHTSGKLSRSAKMQGDWIVRRITLLEQQVAGLNRLPEEVSGLRQDMRSEFAAVRAEIAVLRGEMAHGFAALRSEMDQKFDAVHQVLISLQQQAIDNHRALGTRMLVLHEEVLTRIATANADQLRIASRT